MHRVNRAVWTAAVIALAIAVPASAQPSPRWGGFYLGAHVGRVIGAGEAVVTETDEGVFEYNGAGDTWTFPTDGRPDVGVVAGYNRQSNSLVFGFELDFGKFGFDGNGASLLADNGDTNARSEGGVATSLRGRVGYAAGRYLFFGSAGILSVGTRATVVDQCDDLECGALLIDAAGDSRRTAAVFGAGVEYALSTGNRYKLSIKGEWLKAAFDGYTTKVTGTSDGDEYFWDALTNPPSSVVRFGVNVRF
jgi:hypothetical protein